MVSANNGKGVHGGAKRAAIYCRVSTERQEEEGTSLDTQAERCHDYATAHGYIVLSNYREVHTGAEKDSRPQLNVLLDSVRKREVDVVVAYAVDRLSRDQVHIYVIWDELLRHDVRMEFVTESFEETAVGKFLLSAKTFAGEVEREKIRERSVRGKRARVTGGRIHNHGSELYGYRRNKAEGVRVINEPEAAIVRRIFQWVAGEGVPIREVIRRLNVGGVPPPSVGKLAFADGRQPRWGKGTVRRILREPSYKGETVLWRFKSHGRHASPSVRSESEWVRLADGTTPAIVTLELWQEAQVRLDRNRGESTRNATRQYLLRGLVYCAVCGRKMRAIPEHERRVYRCSSRETATGPCGGHRSSADELEAQVWEKLDAIIHDPSIIAREVERRTQEGPDKSLEAEREAAALSLTKIDRQQERLMRRFREAEDDGFPWELVQREVKAVEKEKAELRKRIADIDNRIASQQAAVAQLEMLEAYCAKVSQNLASFGFNEKRLALEAFNIEVIANGHEWDLRGNAPIEVVGCTTTLTCL